jgi:non-heme chloroperoxidase
MRMVGRDETIKTLCSLVRAKALVTIVGPGGIGKTTVAVAVGHALIAQLRDLARFDKPTLVVHGDDDQVVPIDASAHAAKCLVPRAQLVIYAGGPHGITDTHKERLNKDLLTFIRS